MTTTISHRSRQGICDRPSFSVNPMGDPTSDNASSLAPFQSSECEAVVRDAPVVPSVGILLSLRGPAAIGLLVGSIAVDSVQALVVGSKAHVSDERFYGFAPSLTDENTSRSVVRKTDGPWVMATHSHLVPDVIGATSRQPVRQSRSSVMPQTATTFDASKGQMRRVHDSGTATDTEASPQHLSACGWSTFDHREAGVSLSNSVDKLTHTRQFITINNRVRATVA
jgi:hypothetical protein